MGINLMNPLDRIINIEITCDQACALMAAIDWTRKELREWLETHADASEYARTQTQEMDEKLTNIHKQIFKLTEPQEVE